MGLSMLAILVFCNLNFNVLDVIFDKIGDIDVVSEEFDRIIRHITYVNYKGGHIFVWPILVTRKKLQPSDNIPYMGQSLRTKFLLWLTRCD